MEPSASTTASLKHEQGGTLAPKWCQERLIFEELVSSV